MNMANYTHRTLLNCLLIPVISLLAWPMHARADGTIELRSSVTLSPGDVRLGDIATLQGKDALALADAVILPNMSRSGTRIGLEQVSTALESRGGVNMGTLRFHGSACTVTFPAPKPAVAEIAAPAAPAGPVVRDQLPGRIAELLGIDPAQMRVSFDEADRKLLDQPVSGRVIEIKPVGTGDRMPIQVSVYEDRAAQGHALVATGTVRMGIEVLQEVMIAKAPLKRGDIVTADAVSLTKQWLGVARKPVPLAEVVGAVVRSSKVGAGTVLMDGDVELALAVKKGSLVAIHVISGGFVVKSQARALESGKIGDVIRFSPAAKDIKGAKTFEARIEAPGRAIMSLAADRT
jgi:flagella basal body P-ring formation protein FlgA